MVAIDAGPFGSEIEVLCLSGVDEVASFPVAAVSFLCEGMASFGLVGFVMFHVNL